MNHSRWIRIFSWCIVLTLMMMPLSNQPLAAAEEAIGHDQPASSPASMPTDQIIIKYKVMSLQSGGYAPAGAARMALLSAKAGIELQYVRPMSDEAHVLRLPGRRPESEVQQYADRLMQLAEVEYAEPDRILRPALTPNDPQYSSQWHYSGPYGINAPAAWDITTGANNVVVAVIDTGYRPHNDLVGRFLPGYDFIADVPTANDGNGRDADASDPGDWITSAESNAVGGPFEGCEVGDSSWHGTHVAGTIGANSNNGVGVTGINWVSSIVPVRVLGKCGGYTSDIVDGMRWAAGLSVTGVPANPNPAKVLNISLGGQGACIPTQQNAINAITAAGATVVVAAGNSNADAVNFSPGNCNGVITVAATDRNGYRAPYSNYGSVVEISAPGGNTSVSSNGVLSTLNAGTTVPTTDNYVFYQGTSMATPHVVGVASLLYSLAPGLTPTQIRQILQNTITAFPGGSTCNTSNCGTGIVNAANAVSLLPRITSLSPVSATVGGVTFTLVIHGANFAAGSVVNWNGTPRTTGFVNSTQLTITVSAADLIAPSFVNLTVSGNHVTYGSITTAAHPFPIYSASFGPRVYLPLIAKPSPAAPGTPALNTIANADGNGSYSVAWTFVTGAESYTLQEDDNASFSSPTAVYAGTNLSWPANGKTPGTYYYRVRATNAWGSSGWSGTQAVVVQQTASGPTPGFWESQYDEFYVSSDGASVLNFATYITVDGCGSYKITRITPVPITNNQFSFSGSFYASGTFNSATTASGTDGLNSYVIGGCGTVSGGPWNWNAAWQNSSQPSMPAVVVEPDGTVRLTTVTVTHAAHQVEAH